MANLRAVANNNGVDIDRNAYKKQISAVSALSSYGNGNMKMNKDTIIFNDKNITTTTTTLQPNTTTLTHDINTTP